MENGTKVKITRASMFLPLTLVGQVGIIEYNTGELDFGLAGDEYKINLDNGDWCYAREFQLEAI